MIKKFLLFILVVLGYVIFILFPSNDLTSNGFYESDDKLWAHRVNNLNDIKQLSKEFVGFELDVFYNKNINRFDVKHHGKYSCFLNTYLLGGSDGKAIHVKATQNISCSGSISPTRITTCNIALSN